VDFLIFLKIILYFVFVIIFKNLKKHKNLSRVELKCYMTVTV